jgi:hypothetical protein
MNHRVQTKITCPGCSRQFNFRLYRSVWGEYPENRELVMSDKINVATCPSCGDSTKISYPFIYTNVLKFFAVWWEPFNDPQIEEDQKSYMKSFGADYYLTSVPRVKDWNEFKSTILKFEKGELKSTTGKFGNQAQGNNKQHNGSKAIKSKSGCSLTFLLFLFLGSMAYFSASILF